MATRFQQLGAFVADWNGISYNKLQKFHASGGRWLVPLLAQLGYPDDHDPVAQYNLACIDGIILACNEIGIAVGGWFNGWAKNAEADATQVSQIMHAHDFDGPIVLDCEAEYQYPIGHAPELPKLTAAVRQMHPTRGIIVSTNSPNDSIMVNGGGLGYSKSFQNLGIRLAPQWYPWMGRWGDPEQSMAWIKLHGMEDNWFDATNTASKRAIPLSYVHGTLEATGLEGSQLAPQLYQLHRAKYYGFTYGLSLYTLEAAPDADLDLLAQERGKLFLV